jgi:hypothetical protein
MDDHSGRLVDDDDVFVLIDNLKRDRVRQNLVDPRRGNLDRDNFAGCHAELGLSLLPVDAYPPGFDKSLDGSAAQAGQLVRDIPIQTRAKVVACGPELDKLAAIFFGA